MPKKETAPLNLVDLHIHGYHGPDSQERPENILAKATDLGLIGVAITDHDSAQGYAEVANHNYPVILLPGAEVTTVEEQKPAHILLVTPYRDALIEFLSAFGQGKRPTPGQTIAWAMENYPSVAIIAHPTQRGARSAASFDQIEAWVKQYGNSALAMETANGGMVKFSTNRDGTPTQKALKDLKLYRSLTYLAEKLELPQLGNSDAHKAARVGRSSTNLYETALTTEDVIELILRGACEPYLPKLRLILSGQGKEYVPPDL